MKVFISWSGPKSMAVANLLKRWVKYVLQNSSPWVSTHDIEQGRVAMTQLFDTLNETKIGIICLTPKNHEKPWILFEAGAISSKFDESRVLTLLLDGLEVSDLKPPLGLFQATYPDQKGMYTLLWRINLLLVEPLDRDIFNKVFETYWPQFEQEYKNILKEIKEEGPDIKRDAQDKIDEILVSVRRMNNRIQNLEITPQTIIHNTNKPNWEPVNNEMLAKMNLSEIMVNTMIDAHINHEIRKVYNAGIKTIDQFDEYMVANPDIFTKSNTSSYRAAFLKFISQTQTPSS